MEIHKLSPATKKRVDPRQPKGTRRDGTANNRTLKELATPDLDQQPLCIQYPNLEVAFELKSGLIHLLPTFHGFVGEDPNNHLKEFHVVC